VCTLGLALLAARPGERVLEVGFGTGHALVALARAVGTTGSVSGLDISPGMAGIAQARVARIGCADRVRIQVAEAPPLPFADATFDAAFLSFTLELFPDPVLPVVVEELARVLAPSARLVVVALAVEGRSGLMDRTYEWFHRHFPHIVDCRPIDASALLETAGFTVLEVRRQRMRGLAVEATLARRSPPTRGAG
jgi:demethylmenaquinone methyltransferase/2-methoxy-6-polyprenyl-1,4-benzoquinol methylase